MFVASSDPLMRKPENTILKIELIDNVRDGIHVI